MPAGIRIAEWKRLHAPDELLWRADGTSLAVEMWSYPVINEGELRGSVVTFLGRDRAQAGRTGPASRRKKTRRRRTAQERFSGQHEPRNPDAHERNSGHDRISRWRPNSTQSSGNIWDGEVFRGIVRSRSGMTFSIYQRSKPGQFELDSSDFSIENCIEEALQSRSPSARSRKASSWSGTLLRTSPTSSAAIPTRLRQVLINLTGNALKFTSEGEVAIHVKCDSPRDENFLIHFTVSDTGIGISQENQKKISAHSLKRTCPRRGGSAARVWVCPSRKRLVKLMGGRIWVESAEGKGSRFHFQVLLQSAQEVEVETQPAPTRTFHSGSRVLVWMTMRPTANFSNACFCTGS